MKPEDADRVLAHLAAAWPHVDLPGATALAWYDHMRDIPAEVGTEAARRIVNDDDRFPTVHRFRDIAAAVRRQLEAKAAATRGLPSPPLSDEDKARHLDELRAIKARHFRGGADAQD